MKNELPFTKGIIARVLLAKFLDETWAPEHARMGKGVTLTEAEARAVYEALKERFGNS